MSEHGYSAYTHDHCRCEVCRQAKADYVRARRAAGRQVAQPGVRVDDLKRHGTRFGYEERGCRCDECVGARHASERKYWPARAAKHDVQRINERKA